MGIPILIYGQSGTGKSTSMRNFKSDEIGVINAESKPLPFRNDIKTVNTDSYPMIESVIARSKAKTIVVDDAGYLITNAFMRGHASTGGGNSVFSLYNDIADEFWRLIEFCKGKNNIFTGEASKYKVADDKTIYIIMHEMKTDLNEIKPKTIGKLLDEKVCVEGMFTIVLRSVYKDGKYLFRTKTDGLDVCKSPLGMFGSDEIDNDLKFVDDTIREYYGLSLDKTKENSKGATE